MTFRTPTSLGCDPWEWPEADLRAVVGRVRAGQRLKPTSWPGGARCAVALSFDSDHETSELKSGGTSIAQLSWGEFSSRVGMPKINKLLAQFDVRASFFVPAVCALLYPDEQRQLVENGHEIGLHGWIHEVNSVLPFETERDLYLRSMETIEKIAGVRPVGMRTPSADFSYDTLSIAKELGLEYDSSLQADEDCYELLLAGESTGIVEVPFDWARDDAVYFLKWNNPAVRPQIAPADVLAIWRRDFDAAYEAGSHFQLTMHPNVITHRSRFWILRELIEYALAKGAWFATHAELARYVRNTELAP